MLLQLMSALRGGWAEGRTWCEQWFAVGGCEGARCGARVTGCEGVRGSGIIVSGINGSGTIRYIRYISVTQASRIRYTALQCSGDM